LIITKILSEKSRVDIDIKHGWCINSREILSSYDRIESDLHRKHTNRFSTEVYFNWKTELGISNVWRNNWNGRSISTCKFTNKDVFAVVSAIIGWINESLRKIVHSHVDDNSTLNTGLSAWRELKCFRNGSGANIRRSRWTTGTEISSLYFTATAATISINSVAIITSQNVSFSITTDLITEWVTFLLIISQTASRAWIAINASGTACFAW